MKNRNNNRFVVCGILLLSVLIAFGTASSMQAQEFSSFKPEQYDPDDPNYGIFNFVDFTYFKGDHLTYPNGWERAFSHGYNAVELRLGWEATGRQTWQQLHNHPYYGLGVFTSVLGESDVDSLMGAPSGVYFYYGEPIVRFLKGRMCLYFDLGIGLSYDFNPYNVETNPTNDVIGSRVNLYFNGGPLLLWQADENIDLRVGANFFHFSNGRSNTPQRGINMGGLNVGVRYHFNPVKKFTTYSRPDYRPPVRPTYIKGPKPELKRYGEIQFTAAIGTVMTEPGETKNSDGTINPTAQKRYTTSTVSVEYAYLTTRLLKLHAGLDAFFDGSMENYHPNINPGDVDFAGKFMAGYHVGFQYLIERFAFYYSLGWYLYKESPTRGDWYMRAGGRIGLTDDLDIHLALKTRNGGIADWIEWGLAYKLKVHGQGKKEKESL